MLTALAVSLQPVAAADVEEKSPAVEKPAPTPTPVPIAELSTQAEAVMASLRTIAAVAQANDETAGIDRSLPPLTREIDAGLRENARILAQRPSLELLRNLERTWKTTNVTLTGWSNHLGQRLSGFERDLRRLDDLEATWKETLALAQKEDAPPELVGRAQSVLAGIARTRSTVEAQRTLALKLQSRMAAQQFRVDDAISAVAEARDATLARVFSRDAPPLWRPKRSRAPASASRSTAWRRARTSG